MFSSQNIVDQRQTKRGVLGFKDRSEVNEWSLMGAGDILLLHSDGLLEHARGNELYFPNHLDQATRTAKDLCGNRYRAHDYRRHQGICGPCRRREPGRAQEMLTAGWRRLTPQ